MLRLSQHHSLTIVRSYSDDDRQAEASNCGVWLLYELVAGPCAWAWKIRLIRHAGVTKGTCVAAQELLRGQLCLTVVPLEISPSFVCGLKDRLALHD